MTISIDKQATRERERLAGIVSKAKRAAADAAADLAAAQSKLDEAVRAEAAELLAASAKQKHIERISELLATAKASLIEAGRIAEREDIQFTFTGPRGEDITYNAQWQASDCYGTQGWYDDDN